MTFVLEKHILKLIMIINKGFKMERKTRQQQLILQVLADTKTHPTMQELQALIAKVDPSIGQATIYRTINRCVEKGLVKRIADTGLIYRYDMNHDHYHFKCKNCGKIEDVYLSSEILTSLSEALAPKKITQVDIMIYGICQNCREKNEKEM